MGLLGAVSTCALAVRGGFATAATFRRIAVVDWTIAETMLAMNVVPMAMAEIPAYCQWVGDPLPPPGVQDLGLRVEPNLELLAQLKPELILSSPQFQAASRQLEAIAPVRFLGVFSEDRRPYDNARRMAAILGEWCDCPRAAEGLLAFAERRLLELRARLSAFSGRTLCIVQFVDDRHLRVFDKRSLYSDVLERLSLRNAWPGDGSTWGFEQAGLEQLLQAPEAMLVVVSPVPPDTLRRLPKSALWQSLPAVGRNRVLWLPASWSFGGVPAALRFAGLLTNALLGRSSS